MLFGKRYMTYISIKLIRNTKYYVYKQNFGTSQNQIENRNLTFLQLKTRQPKTKNLEFIKSVEEQKNCNQKYVEQTVRTLNKRFVEHLTTFKSNHPEQFSITFHMLKTNIGRNRNHLYTHIHSTFNINNLKLSEEVNDERRRRLNPKEALYIKRADQNTSRLVCRICCFRI
jgi:hypothetical protein